MVEVNASLLSINLVRRFANRKLLGKIHSRFEHAINIELEDGYLFNLLPETIPPNSRSLILPREEWDRIHTTLACAGLRVLVDRCQVKIPTLQITIGYGCSRLWNPGPSLDGPSMTPAEIRRNLEFVSTVVTQHAGNGNPLKNIAMEPYSIFENIHYEAISEVDRDPFVRAMSQAANLLFVSISTLDFENVRRASSQLIGLGPGLTPTGDDVLAGVMAAGIYFSLAYEFLRPEVERINSTVISLVPGRTTTYAQVLLSDASRGEVVRPLSQLLRRIVCDNQAASVVSLARQVMVIGDSSGKDTFAGTLIGMEALLRLAERMNATQNGLNRSQRQSGMLRYL